MPTGLDIAKPMCAATRITLLAAIAKARAWAEALICGRIEDLTAIAKAENRSERQIRSLLALAFVAPDIIAAALDHRLPEGFGVSRFEAELPVDWVDQRTWIGLPPR